MSRQNEGGFLKRKKPLGRQPWTPPPPPTKSAVLFFVFKIVLVCLVPYYFVSFLRRQPV